MRRSIFSLLNVAVLLLVVACEMVVPTTPMAPSLLFDFEDGSTGGWNTSEGDSKLAQLIPVASPVYAGNGSLGVLTELNGNGDDIYRHTEAKVYFVPINMEGYHSRLWVYFPRAVLDNQGYIEFLHYVSDESFRNQYDARVRLDETLVDKWILLDLVVGSPEAGGQKDDGFDSTKITGAGVRLETYGEFSFTGLVAFVDDVYVGVIE